MSPSGTNYDTPANVGGKAYANTINGALTALDKLVVDPEAPKFGAVGDGTTDDTTSFAAALAAASASKRKLFLRPGRTYKLTAIPTLWSGCVIEGYGATLDIQTDHSAAGRYLNVPNLLDVEIYGLKLICSNASARNQVNGLISIFGGSHILLEDLEIASGEGIGIFTASASVTTAAGTKDLHIVRPKIGAVYADGIHISRGASDVWITEANVDGCGDDGIAINSIQTDDGTHDYNQIERVHITDPTVKNLSVLGSGVDIIGAKDVTIANPVVDTVHANGVRVSNDTGGAGEGTHSASDIDVSNPHIRGCHDSGLIFGPVEGVTVNGGSSRGSAVNSGVEFSASTKCLVIGTNLRGNAGFGVYEHAGSTGCHVRECDLRDNTAGTKHFDDAGNTADNCIEA